VVVVAAARWWWWSPPPARGSRLVTKTMVSTIIATMISGGSSVRASVRVPGHGQTLVASVSCLCYRATSPVWNCRHLCPGDGRAAGSAGPSPSAWRRPGATWYSTTDRPTPRRRRPRRPPRLGGRRSPWADLGDPDAPAGWSLAAGDLDRCGCWSTVRRCSRDDWRDHPARWDRTLAVNLRAPVFLTQAFAAALPEAWRGRW